MQDWTSGYVADIGYTYGYYSELNPLRSRLALIHAGFRPAQTGVHCELGFGQGLSINVHSAAGDAVWYGTDFNPSQAAHAQELARACDNGACLYEQSFEEFCQRTDLPEFDSIGLHGIWSWINDKNRSVIVDFVRRKLKVGGVLHISYNTQPGWAAMVPMRELLTVHASRMGSEGGGIVAKIDAALDFASQLLEAKPTFAKSNPQIAERLSKIKEQNRNYLAHEYFNRDWHPMSFAAMSEWLTPAKMDFACSANYLDAVDAINLTQAQIKLLNEIKDPLIRQMSRDFCVNQQFRKDYWIKGMRTLNAYEQATCFRNTHVMLSVARSEVNLKVNTSIGQANLSAPVYEPILDLLADHLPYTLGEIEQKLSKQGIKIPQIVQAVMVLCGMQALCEVQEETVQASAQKNTAKLNKHLLDKAKSSADISYLASPVTGGGIAVGRFAQLFMLARENGHRTPQSCAQATWEILAQQNQRLIKEGKLIENANDNLKELTSQALNFDDKHLPVLKALKIAL